MVVEVWDKKTTSENDQVSSHQSIVGGGGGGRGVHSTNLTFKKNLYLRILNPKIATFSLP